MVAELDPAACPKERCDEDPDVSFDLPPLPTEAVEADPCGVIDMMMLYTPAAKDQYGGKAGRLCE